MTKLSKCCGAAVKVVGIPDFGDGHKDDIHTCYHVCLGCGLPTDLSTRNQLLNTPVDTNNPEEESQDIMKSTMPRSGQAWDITTDLKALWDKAFAAGQKFERESIKAEIDKLLQ